MSPYTMDHLKNICEVSSQSLDISSFQPMTHRKGKKLLAEKKRRARINNCLTQIRDIVCEGDLPQDSDVDKMEKAEILEKTLEVLTKLRSRHTPVSHNSTITSQKAMASRYASGFSTCAEESIRYIQSSRLVPSQVKVQIQNHLRSIARQVETVLPVEDKVAKVECYPATPYTTNSMQVQELCTLQQQPTNNIDTRMCYIPSPIQSSTPISKSVYPQLPQDRLVVQVDEKFYAENENKDPVYSTQEYSREKPTSFEQKVYQPSHEHTILPIHVNSAFTKTNISLTPSAIDNHPICQPQPSYSYNYDNYSTMPTSPSKASLSEQPLYQYYGYEPVAFNSPVKHHPYHSSTPVYDSGINVTCDSSSMTPKTPTSHALNLCTKRDSQQISPETMWRPW